MSVREPPKPWKLERRPPGSCSLCGAPVSGRRRTWCSDDCVRIWWLATSPTSARYELTALHGHRCWSCDAVWEPGVGRIVHFTGSEYVEVSGPPLPRPVALELEHVRPLWSLDERERLELRWWLPFNLQMLCVRCHQAKTAAEAGQRARLRRQGGRFQPSALHEQLTFT